METTPSSVVTEPPPSRSAHSLDGLLLSVAQGDHAAFAELYDLTVGRVFALAGRVVRNSSDAEEVTQDVYLEVWRRAGSFAPARGSAISWVLMVAHARAVDKVRSSTAARNRIIAQSRQPAPPEWDPVLENVLRTADVERVGAAMQDLSDYRREALMFAFYSDHTYQEASDILQVPVGTFKSRVRDGLLAMRGMLA